MSFNDHRSEVLELLNELDRLAEEQRLIDARDPNALVQCERKLEELRRRIAQLQSPNESGSRRLPRQ
jgi:hypothetical protein